MATNTITIEFQPCQPTPGAGYQVSYRPLGSDEDYRVAPANFTASPAVIVDTLDAPGTEYEGFVQGDCGGGRLGVRSRFATGTQESPSESGSGSPVTLRVSNDLLFVGITAIYTIPATGGPSDARLATVAGGYPVGPGQQRDATIHPDHDGDGDLEVIVYFSSAVFGDTRARVTDSDGAQDCAAGTFVAVIGVDGPFRMSNAEDWAVNVSNVPC